MEAAHFDVVIVGAGHAGAQTAIALRQNGFEGSVALVGRESELPYERPPLSKDYLAGEKAFDRLLIRPSAFWRDKNIELLLSSTAESVSAEAKVVLLKSGKRISYGKLVWATGGDPRALPCSGAKLKGVHAIRDKADADSLISALALGARRVVIVGGGYIGLEAAAFLAKLDCQVTLLEALPRLLARVAGEDLSNFFVSEHRSHGVDIRFNCVVEELLGNEDGHVRAVKVASDEEIETDLVIVGIGIAPAVNPLLEAGAVCSNGVEVDEFCRTSLPDIYAVGDCAAHANQYAGGARVRLESVQNANDMANVVAKVICGNPSAYDALPWFWSNQYDLKLQTAGISTGHDNAVVRGDPATRCFSVAYLRDGHLIALDAVNSTKDYVQAQKAVKGGAVLDPAVLANPRVAIKDMMADRDLPPPIRTDRM